MVCPKTGSDTCSCMTEQILKAVFVAALLNLVLPFLLKPFATAEEIKPPQGAYNLSYRKQLMHMAVHHAQVPLTSSVIVSIIVTIAVYLSRRF